MKCQPCQPMVERDLIKQQGEEQQRRDNGQVLGVRDFSDDASHGFCFNPNGLMIY
jgi:hypothetical protein